MLLLFDRADGEYELMQVQAREATPQTATAGDGGDTPKDDNTRAHPALRSTE